MQLSAQFWYRCCADPTEILAHARGNREVIAARWWMGRVNMSRCKKLSAPSGFRTPDPLIKSQLLYQLS